MILKTKLYFMTLQTCLIFAKLHDFRDYKVCIKPEVSSTEGFTVRLAKLVLSPHMMTHEVKV